MQNDTRSSPLITPLPELFSFAQRPPFTQLCDWFQLQFSNCEAPSSIALGKDANAIADLLNLLLSGIQSDSQYVFKAQNPLLPETRGYEQTIFEEMEIPTRDNWHDFFNGIIWCQFSNTKALLNRLHYQQIEHHGGKLRSRVRDRLTHFDECGVVLFSAQPDLISLLKNHQWQTLFVEQKNAWHEQIVPIIFGHALWEMLMQPFIGITAKVTVIELSQQALNRIYELDTKVINYEYCDYLLHKHLQKIDLEGRQKTWMPLPLLGVPNWSPYTQTTEFYSNQKYFMPLKQKKACE